jgi:hypothetical protein
MTRGLTIGVLENVRRWRAQVPLSVSIMRASDARGSESGHPIRSFLIDSARATALASMPVQKKFGGGG